MVTAASLALDGNSHPLIHPGNAIYDWATREMCATTVTSGDHLTYLFRFIKLLLLSFSKKILRPSKNQRN